MWASGHYDAVATQLIAELGPVLVEATGIRTGDLVLDVGAGSGNVAIPAALAGARVIASDLTPELLEQGEAHARERGAVLEWQVADAERLPYDDGQFDVAVSAVGIMFAPHHQAAADELLRVVTPGGRIGLVSWTPAGFIGQMFATMKPFVAPPPAGVQPPPLWGDEDHVRGLLGDRVTDVRTEKRTVRVTLFAEPADFREFFKTNYGPTIAAYKQQPDAEKAAELDAALDGLAERFDVGESGYLVLEWEYLLLTARRA
jgi:SAM-dependent methyltransferase